MVAEVERREAKRKGRQTSPHLSSHSKRERERV